MIRPLCPTVYWRRLPDRGNSFAKEKQANDCKDSIPGNLQRERQESEKQTKEAELTFTWNTILHTGCSETVCLRVRNAHFHGKEGYPSLTCLWTGL